MNRREEMFSMNEIKNNPYILKYIEEQTPEICLAAVKQDGLALQYLKEQTREICLEAVRRNGMALQYVNRKTPEICIAAVKQNEDADKYIENVKIFDVKKKERKLKTLYQKIKKIINKNKKS